MPTGRDSGEFDAEELLRILVVIGGWIGFVWMWLLVGRQPWDSGRLVWLILGTLIVVPLLTFAWVLHNRAIFRRKGERRGASASDFSYATDWHGRTVSADWAQLQRSRFVTVGVNGSVKSYRCGSMDIARSLPAPFTLDSRVDPDAELRPDAETSRY